MEAKGTMSPLIGILIILTVVLGIIAFTVWKVLSAPVTPPAAAAESKASPLFETTPPEQVRLDTPPVRTEEPPARPDSSSEKVLKGVSVAIVLTAPMGIVAPFVALAAKKAISRQFNPLKMSGGDECLGRNRASLRHKDRETPTVKVAVSASGKIELDGRETSFAELEERLADLKAKGGKACYWCEPAAPEPPQAAQVLDCILRSRVPVTFSGNG